MSYNYSGLNPDKALIWRITHRENLPWLLRHGLHAGNGLPCPDWISIGNAELTTRRGERVVPLPPGGVLNDYVPFYFTPFSPMLLNISSGRNGVVQRPMQDIVILVSSLWRIGKLGLPFLFTDSHAYYQYANYYSDLSSLDQVDWPLLQSRDFKRDMSDPAKFERYQAEALVHQRCPVEALKGIICHNSKVAEQVNGWLQQAGVNLPVHARPGWYF